MGSVSTHSTHPKSSTETYQRQQKVIEDTEEDLKSLDGVTTIHSRFYELASNYYRIIGNHSDYYRNALRYLGCRDFQSMTSLFDFAKYLFLTYLRGIEIKWRRNRKIRFFCVLRLYWAMAYTILEN
jgi:hypothetical protein